MSSETATKNDLSSGDARNAAGRTRPHYDDVNVPVVVLIGIISAVLTFLTIAFVQGLWSYWNAAFVDNSPNPAIMEIIDSQKALLTANPETGRLSIDETMKTIATELAQPGSSDQQNGTPAVSDDHDNHEQSSDNSHEQPEGSGDEAESNEVNNHVSNIWIKRNPTNAN